MPRVNINGYQALSRDANRQGDSTTNVQGQFNATQVRGSHTLRGGVDLRRAMRGRAAGGFSSGAFTFTRDYTRQASDEAQLTPSNLGLSLAAFMLGVPTSIQVEDPVSASFYNHYVGTFAQDTWRIGRNLTVNAGLRFEYEDGIREKDNRMLVGFDPNALTSISQAAETAYVASGVPNTAGMLPRISVRGGAIYATDPGQDGATWQGQAMWMPRLSAAYKLGERVVLRAGYGLYYDTLNAGDQFPSQTGFVSHGTETVRLGGLLMNLSTGQGDPFPARRRQHFGPHGSSLSFDTILGSPFTEEPQTASTYDSSGGGRSVRAGADVGADRVPAPGDRIDRSIAGTTPEVERQRRFRPTRS
jgi:hypothetical protein